MSHGNTSRTALLIDDEAYFRRFVGQVLKSLAIERILEARDGNEGVALFQANPPDFVLLDISMPHMDGVQTLAALRKLSSTTPIIMLTSVAEENVVEECVEMGATYFIRKDVPAQELSSALKGLLGELLDLRGSAP